MKKFIIITSIFEPTEAVKKFAEIDGWQLVVVGDKKSPPSWSYGNVVYLGPQDQERLPFQLIKLLPWNHYGRKMAGYLYAINEGAEIIADTDDDNIPLDAWPSLSDTNKFQTLSGPKFVNIYRYFTDERVWPRGYPLNLLSKNEKPNESISESEVKIWQFLANEDPDVDAIYRLTNNNPIHFRDHPPLVLDTGTVCPFNSQNTIFSKEAFPLLYLPAFVTFRFTDILRGLVAQPLLWSNNYRLGFGGATVIQKRNPHDYLKDFESEIPVYLYSERVIDITSSVKELDSDIGLDKKLIKAYEALRKENIVDSRELELLNAWVDDINSLDENIR
jgi:hypothetical protein